jgi:hypothetical protein
LNPKDRDDGRVRPQRDRASPDRGFLATPPSCRASRARAPSRSQLLRRGLRSRRRRERARSQTRRRSSPRCQRLLGSMRRWAGGEAGSVWRRAVAPTTLAGPA